MARNRQRGRGGETSDYAGIFKKHALVQYVQRLELDPSKKAPEIIADLIEHESASAEEIHQLIDSGIIKGNNDAVYYKKYLGKRQAAAYYDGNDNIEAASAQAQKADPESSVTEHLRTTSKNLLKTDSTTLDDLEELQAAALQSGNKKVADEIGKDIAQLQGEDPPTAQELQETLQAGTPSASAKAADTSSSSFTTPPGSPSKQVPPASPAIPKTESGVRRDFEEAGLGDEAPDPSLTSRPSSGRVKNPEQSTVHSDENVAEQQRKMEALADELFELGQTTQAAIGDQTAAITAAVMDVNDNLKGTRKLLGDNIDDAKEGAAKIALLEEAHPKTKQLFERGLISADQMKDSSFVQAMEKSLNLREEREGKIKSRSIRQTQPQMYARTVPRPGGVYQYRRPHFSTSPMFETTGISKPRSGAR